jgi:hypothetical protein
MYVFQLLFRTEFGSHIFNVRKHTSTFSWPYFQLLQL